MRFYSVFASVILIICCFSSCNADRSTILFEDSFGPETQGKLQQNIIQLPPPAGLGYKSKVLQNGYDPLKWEMVDEMGLNAGIEFGYMTQVPGSDSTVSDAYLSGAFGEKLVKGMALRHAWAKHHIEVRDGRIEWYINDQLMGSIEENGKSTHGYFGIRQRYERNTRYDDVQIILH